MTETTPTPKASGYRFWLHERKTEREWSDAWAEFYSTLAVASFRLVQWGMTIGAIQAVNKIAPSAWLSALEGFLWILLFGYVTANLSIIEIDFFRQVNTRVKLWVNLIITMAISGALIYATTQATQSIVNAISHAPKP
jgi:hypothetical protein